MQTGVEAFLQGLRDLGYEPAVLKDKPDHVVIDYTVESGKFGHQAEARFHRTGRLPRQPSQRHPRRRSYSSCARRRYTPHWRRASRAGGTIPAGFGWRMAILVE